MNNKTFPLVTGIVFSVIAVLHLLRIILGWRAEIGGLVLPVWVSWFALVAAGYLAYSAFKLWKKN